MTGLLRRVSQLLPHIRALRPEPLPASIKKARFLSRKLLLVQVALIGRQIVAFRSSHCQGVTTFVFDMARMTFDPLPVQFVLPAYRVETFP